VSHIPLDHPNETSRVAHLYTLWLYTMNMLVVYVIKYTNKLDKQTFFTDIDK